MSSKFARPLPRRARSAEVQPSEAQRRAQSALTSNPVYSLRELTVESRDDSLLISGSVSSFYHKQLAQEAVRAVAGPMNVVNSVHVEAR